MKTKTKILIVEHDTHDIELLEYELKKGGIDYVSEIVQNEKEFNDALKIFIPDIILCDYSLPSFDGSTAFEMKEKIVPETPFIFVSGAIGEENSIQFVENGVTDYALKDKLFTLSTKVKRALKDSKDKQLKKRTDLKLAVSEGKLARAQQIAMVGSWELDFTTNLLTLSDEGCRIFGFPLNNPQLSLERWHSLVHPNDIDSVLQIIKESRDTISDTSFYYRIVLPNSQIRHIYSEGKFEFNLAGVPTGLFGIIQDITGQKDSEEKLKKANRLYAFISQINQSIVRLKSEEALFRNSCRIALEFGKFQIAWIGIFNTTGTEITLAEQKGLSQDDIHLFTNTLCVINGPQHYVLRTGKHYICNNIERDFEQQSWKYFATKHGISSMMVLPVRKSGCIIGTFNLYAKEIDFFDTVEIALLEEVTGDVSFAIDIFEKVKKHKATEEQVIQNEKRFRGLIEKSTDMITLTNLEGEFVYCSPAVTKVFEYAQEDFFHKPSSSFFHPDDIPDLIKTRTEILSAPGKSFSFQYRMLHKNGSWIWCEGTLTNMLHEPGIFAMVSNFRDISENKKSELQREFNENNLHALINNTSDLMWSVDKDFRLITCNQPFNDTMKCRIGHEISKASNILEASPTIEQFNMYKKFYERAFTGETFTEIGFNATPDDYWYEVSFQPIFKGKEVIGTACRSRNVTSIKKAEYQLKKSEAFNRAVLNSLSSHIAVIDVSGNIVAVNDSWKRFVLENGKSALQHAASGNNYFNVCKKAAEAGDLFAGEVLKGIQEVMKGNLADFYIEYPSYAPEQQRWFGMRVVKFESSEPMIVMSHMNITERKLAEAEREKMIADITQRNSTLEQFTYIVSHNLRAPIAKILGLASIIESDSPENNFLIEKVVEETTLLDNVVTDINTIVSARSCDKGKMEIVFFETKLNQVKKVLETEIMASKALITANFSEIAEVFTIKSYLYSIFYNLISNAIKYRLPEVPLRIHIQSTQDENFVCLSVDDNGRGINLVKNGTKIFGLYKRFHEGSIPGRGIGLNLVKAHIESMGGRVEVASKINEGTVFKIYIPKAVESLKKSSL